MKTIPDFPNYAVTKDGRVWSKKRITTQNHVVGATWLKGHRDKDGYLIVCLRENGNKKSKKVHRLVLETYIGPCPEGMECRHLDGNPRNNNLSNLKWGTPSQNQIDAVNHGTSAGFLIRGERHPWNKLTEEQVRVIFHAYHDGIVTQTELAKQFGVHRITIHDIVKKRNWKWLWKI